MRGMVMRGSDFISARRRSSDEEWIKELQSCQYVVVFHADELFRQSYGEVFKETEIKDGSVYRVLNESGDVTLFKIGTTGIKGWH